MTKHVLEGRTITGLMIAEDRKAIKVETTEGDVVARCDADCCSYTWIENVELPVNGLPAKVLSAEEIEMPDLGNGDTECTQYYGFSVKTDGGDIVIDYRNESNGYYGGSLVWPDEESRFYGGVYGQNVSAEKWQEVKP